MILSHNDGCLGSAKVERCQRDYESEIKRATERKDAYQDLADAVEKFTGTFSTNDTLNAIFGEATLQAKAEQIRIDSLVAEQEKAEANRKTA